MMESLLNDVRPMTNPLDFVSTVIKLKDLSKRGNVTLVRMNLTMKMSFGHRLSGSSVFDKLIDFQRLYGSQISSIVEDELMDEGGPEYPAAGLRGLNLLRKNELLSTMFRDVGNEMFMVHDFSMALRCFTIAASYAPPGSRAEKMAYTSRSACYAKFGEWQKCLDEIALFEKVEADVAPTVVDMTYNRKLQCLSRMLGSMVLEDDLDADLQFAKQLLMVLKDESKTIPGAEEFVGIRKDEEKGRGLFNKGDTPIEPGTLVILDQAYVHAQLLCIGRAYCSACYRDLEGGGIPCPTCVFTLYCSETCAASDYAAIHAKYECKVLPHLYELRIMQRPCKALAVLFKLGPQGLLAHLRQPKRDGEDSIPGFSPEGVYDSKSYEAVKNLALNEKIVGIDGIMQCCFFAIVATKLVDGATDYFTSLVELEPELDVAWVKDEFTKLVFRHQLVGATNDVTVNHIFTPTAASSASHRLGSMGTENVGSSLCPLFSLLNHSCDPNVVYLSLPDGLMAILTIQHVAPGQEFLASYGPTYYATPKMQRQKDLVERFGFLCNCPPCKHDWVKAVHLGLVCPECRPTHDIHSKMSEGLTAIKLEKSAVGDLVCLSCQRRSSQAEFARKNTECEQLSEAGIFNINRNMLKRAFLNFQKSVKMADSHLMRPDDVTAAEQENLGWVLWLLAGKLWRVSK